MLLLLIIAKPQYWIPDINAHGTFGGQQNSETRNKNKVFSDLNLQNKLHKNLDVEFININIIEKPLYVCQKEAEDILPALKSMEIP